MKTPDIIIIGTQVWYRPENGSKSGMDDVLLGEIAELRDGTESQAKILEELADDNGWEFTPDYSGRAMYGDKCVGIVGPDDEKIIEKAAAAGVTGARIDSMGKSVIVYWPRIQADDDQLEEDGCGTCGFPQGDCECDDETTDQVSSSNEGSKS